MVRDREELEDCAPVQKLRKEQVNLSATDQRRLSIMSWEFGLAIIANIIVAVYFITTSQAEQDIELAAHEQRIQQNERLLESVFSERVAVARLEEQIRELKGDIAEIKQLLREE